jgi:hypothetical protein
VRKNGEEKEKCISGVVDIVRERRRYGSKERKIIGQNLKYLSVRDAMRTYRLFEGA